MPQEHSKTTDHSFSLYFASSVCVCVCESVSVFFSLCISLSVFLFVQLSPSVTLFISPWTFHSKLPSHLFKNSCLILCLAILDLKNNHLNSSSAPLSA